MSRRSGSGRVQPSIILGSGIGAGADDPPPRPAADRPDYLAHRRAHTLSGIQAQPQYLYDHQGTAIGGGSSGGGSHGTDVGPDYLAEVATAAAQQAFAAVYQAYGNTAPIIGQGQAGTSRLPSQQHVASKSIGSLGQMQRTLEAGPGSTYGGLAVPSAGGSPVTTRRATGGNGSLAHPGMQQPTSSLTAALQAQGGGRSAAAGGAGATSTAAYRSPRLSTRPSALADASALGHRRANSWDPRKAGAVPPASLNPHQYAQPLSQSPSSSLAVAASPRNQRHSASFVASSPPTSARDSVASSAVRRGRVGAVAAEGARGRSESLSHLATRSAVTQRAAPPPSSSYQHAHPAYHPHSAAPSYAHSPAQSSPSFTHSPAEPSLEELDAILAKKEAELTARREAILAGLERSRERDRDRDRGRRPPLSPRTTAATAAARAAADAATSFAAPRDPGRGHQRRSSLEELAALEAYLAARRTEMTDRGVLAPGEMASDVIERHRVEQRRAATLAPPPTSAAAVAATPAKTSSQVTAALNDLEAEIARLRAQTLNIGEKVAVMEAERAHNCRAPDALSMRKGARDEAQRTAMAAGVEGEREGPPRLSAAMDSGARASLVTPLPDRSRSVTPLSMPSSRPSLSSSGEGGAVLGGVGRHGAPSPFRALAGSAERDGRESVVLAPSPSSAFRSRSVTPGPRLTGDDASGGGSVDKAGGKKPRRHRKRSGTGGAP